MLSDNLDNMVALLLGHGLQDETNVGGETEGN